MIPFSGSATDPQQGTLPASALSWNLLVSTARPPRTATPTTQELAGCRLGHLAAPDHAYPSYLELRLTATDAGGLTDTQSVRLDPRTVQLTFTSSPAGLQLTFNGETATAAFTRTVIEGSANSLSAPDAPAAQGRVVGLPILVGRRRPEPHPHRPRERHHLHGLYKKAR